jgi:tripartite-type tricarboxylate transporter receptor subunit TctC
MNRRECLHKAGFFCFWVLLLGGFLCGPTSAAEGDFPKKEITIIVNYGAGGGRDILTRGLGKTMGKHLGVPMVVMNMPGAGGARGLISLYHSAPDGYTIGINGPGEIIDEIVEKKDYENKKFIYIGRAQSSPLFLLVKSDSPFHSLKDLKSFGKPIRISTFSLTSSATVAPILTAEREGFPISIVGGYQGGAAALLGLVRGEVECHFSPMSTALSFLQSKQVRPILTYYERRSPDFPDIPSVRDIGYGDLSTMSVDYYFITPPGVPKAQIQILEEAFTKTLKDPEFVEWAKGAGVDLAPLGSEETTRVISNLFALLEQYKGTIEKYIKK